MASECGAGIRSLPPDRPCRDGAHAGGEVKYFVTVAGKEMVVDGASHALAMDAVGRGQWAVGYLGEQHELEVVDERTRHIRSLTGAGQKGSGPTTLKAPMPGLVVRVSVEEGSKVE